MNQDVISDVALFTAVIDSGSFLGASARLGISKPSVSRRIHALEKALKTKLIKRCIFMMLLTISVWQ